MKMQKRKSRIICFRLSPEEYEQFREMCIDHSVRNISDLARTALNRMRTHKGAVWQDDGASIGKHRANAANTRSIPLRIRELQERLRVIAADVDALSKQLTPGSESGLLFHAKKGAGI